MDRVKNKVVLVTGGGSGIGRATSVLLAKEGATVAVADLNDSGGQKTVELIAQAGGNARFWHLDTSKESEVATCILSIVEAFGKIDGLVNNAGIGGDAKKTHECTEAEWDAVLAVNVKGVFFCTKHVIPHMIKNGGGSIANISSVAGLIGAALPDGNGIVPYSASKGAVRLMSKTDALIYAKDKIRVNSVHPGLIMTAIYGSLGITKPMLDQAAQMSTPLGRSAEPEEVAYGILFLISDESSFMTGSELVIDGGMTAR